MDAFVRGESVQLWGLCKDGHDGIMGLICNTMGCLEIVVTFTGADVRNAKSVAIGKIKHDLIEDYKLLWGSDR